MVEVRFDRHRFTLSVPTVLVHSGDAAIPEGAHQFFDRLTVPKQQHWLTGDQFDFYDEAVHVATASDLVARFLGAHLAAGR